MRSAAAEKFAIIGFLSIGIAVDALADSRSVQVSPSSGQGGLPAQNIFLLAQGTSPDVKGTVPSPNDPSSQPLPGTGDSRLKDKLNNAAFIEKAALGAITEIKASRMAEKKGTTPAIRDFAALMVKDHSAASKQLGSAAAAIGAPVPSELDGAHMAAVQKLAGLSGEEFDSAYISLMRQDHDAAVALFENASGELSLAEDLRHFAARNLATLRNHQLQAHNLGTQ